MIVLTQAQKAAIAKADKINTKINVMLQEIDDLLTPIADLVSGSTDAVEIRALADLLPIGFYRSELRMLASVL